MIAAASAAGPIDRQPSAGSNRVLSPTTVAYWQQRDNGDGTGFLDVLVLWRGTPAWFLRGNGTSGGGGGHIGFGRASITHWMTYGDVTLTVDLSSRSNDFDPATAVVKILDQEILLRDANVIMIDGVDSSTPSFVGTRYVEPRFTGKDAVAAIVKRTPELFEFLRCDIVLPDANQQAMMTLLCDQMRP